MGALERRAHRPSFGNRLRTRRASPRSPLRHCRCTDATACGIFWWRRADVPTVEARRGAYGLLLRKGLIRVGLPVPAGAEFELVGVDDPYGYASAAELSLFRRPLPSTNLRFLTTIMWDGRAADLA